MEVAAAAGTVIAWLPAGQAEHATVMVAEATAAGAAAAAAAGAATADAAAARADEAADRAAGTPEALARLTTEVAAAAGTVIAWLPAGQVGHATVTVVTLVAAARAEEAAATAAGTPEALARATMEVAAATGQVIAWLPAGHVGHATVTVVTEGLEELVAQVRHVVEAYSHVPAMAAWLDPGRLATALLRVLTVMPGHCMTCASQVAQAWVAYVPFAWYTCSIGQVGQNCA